MELQIKKYSANIRNTKQNLIGFIFPAIKGNETYYNIIVNELTMPNSIYRGVFVVDQDTIKEVGVEVVDKCLLPYSFAQDYAEFCIICERENLPLIKIEDYLERFGSSVC